jgi:hypothetical protein
LIINVGLSPSSLVDISVAKVGQAPHALTIQRAMADSLRSHGSVMFSSIDEANAVTELIRGKSYLTEPERQLWANVFSWLTQGGRVQVSLPPFCALETLQSTDHATLIPHRPFVAVVPDAIFSDLYPGNNDGWAPTTADVDITMGAAVSASAQFSRARSAAARDYYPSGTDREVVWEELLRPLARRAKSITLLDRYVFAEIYRREVIQDSAAEHLVWLLRKLDAEGRPGTLVKIYGATGYGYGPKAVPSSPALIAQVLQQRWSPTGGRLARVELVTLDGLGNFPHDRHAKFGEMTGLELPSGFDRLAPAVTTAPFSFGYKWMNEQMQALRDRVGLVDHQQPEVTTAYVAP